MKLPLSVGKYGDLIDKDGKALLITGAAIPCGPRSEDGEANRDFIITAVNSYNLLRETIASLVKSSNDSGDKNWGIMVLVATEGNQLHRKGAE